MDGNTRNRPKAIIGLGFGDEAKGLASATLCEHISRSGGTPLVVRFNGAAQAAHNVRIRGLHHTFSQFGSGTLSGAGTLLTDRMLVSPIALMNEAADLMSLGYRPLQNLYIDRYAPILLPVHAKINQALEESRGKNRHGSVGIGVGVARTYEEEMDDAGRHGVVPRVDDMANPFVLADKMAAMLAWLQNRFGVSVLEPTAEIRRLAIGMHTLYDDLTGSGATITATGNILYDYRDRPDTIVFEGSQGVMLDTRYGYFPYVTYGEMLADGVYGMCSDAELPVPVVIGCTRTYSTRHGNGPFYPEGTADIVEDDNMRGRWQGAFRTGLLDLGTLEYAAGLLKPDMLSISCMDTYPGSAIVGYADDNGNTGGPIIEKMSLDDAVAGIRRACGDVPVAMEGHGETVEQWRIL